MLLFSIRQFLGAMVIYIYRERQWLVDRYCGSSSPLRRHFLCSSFEEFLINQTACHEWIMFSKTNGMICDKFQAAIWILRGSQVRSLQPFCPNEAFGRGGRFSFCLCLVRFVCQLVPTTPIKHATQQYWMCYMYTNVNNHSACVLS